MKYDITDQIKAATTLQDLLGIKWSVINRTLKYGYTGDFYEDLENLIMEKGNLAVSDYRALTFTVQHVTTSNNNCKSIKEYGIMPLDQTYENPSTDLRMFLDKHDIRIDLEAQILSYCGHQYDINNSFRRSKSNHKDKYGAFIGNKFYNEPNVWGFLCLQDYSSCIWKSPEVIVDIDTLLNIGLERDWITRNEGSKTYAVTFEADGRVVGFSGYSYADNDEVIKKLIDLAAEKAFTNRVSPDSQVVRVEQGISVPPENITSIIKL